MSAQFGHRMAAPLHRLAHARAYACPGPGVPRAWRWCRPLLQTSGVRMIRSLVTVLLFTWSALSGALVTPISAQTQTQPQPGGSAQQPGGGTQPSGSKAASTASTAPLPVVPKGYVIGAEDVLSIVVWREKEISSDVIVRPDGMISLPLLRDVQAAGYTPEQLAEIIEKAALKFVTDSDTTVIVKQINSRKVFVLGEVAKPGVFPLTTEMNVLQLISAVGGLNEYADKGNITIIRNENGTERRHKFNYNEVISGKKLQQNIMLQPNDTVLVR
jgi:polysaccharide export outer membrane protein